MLEKRILATLKFFDFQQLPLTLFEVYRYLVPSVSLLAGMLDENYELQKKQTDPLLPAVSTLDQVAQTLEFLVRRCLVGVSDGFYYLPGKKHYVHARIRNYVYSIPREQRITRVAWVWKWMPFVRGVALAGSQALGLPKRGSDIDLLIITRAPYLWIPRMCVTLLLQLLGLRRHGVRVANRFCLNHYVSGPKKVTEHRNFYTAAEYVKLRPFMGASCVRAFQQANAEWLKMFFPNAFQREWIKPRASRATGVGIFESYLLGSFGRKFEDLGKRMLLPRIRQERYIVVADDELSFHPQSKQENLLRQFFEFYQQQNGERLELIVQVKF